ncbi:ELP5 protein, partial [Rhinopomastus cyanomelas]|nr:ELP5 protein [Rhinopomastus cyanomelas]
PGVPPQVLALLHQELHPPGLLQALEGLASIQLILWGTHQLGSPCLVTISSPPRRGGGTHKDETFTVRPDGSLGVAPPFPKLEEMGVWSSGATLGTPQGGGGRTPPHPLTFRLQLSAAERAARAALTPPYQLSPTRKSLLLAPGTLGCDSEPPQDEDFEDPDDDLDV